MKKYLKFLFIISIAFCFTSCSSDDEPKGPDVNNVNNSLDSTFAKLSGKYRASWSERFNDISYEMTFTPYSSPEYQDIRISNGGSVNFTKRVRIFGRVNVIQTYLLSSGTSIENSNKSYVYGIESTVGEPYEIVFYPYNSMGESDIIYGISSSYYIKNISQNSFYLSMLGKNGEYHLFEK